MTGAQVKKLREKLGMPQSEFWGRVGLTQSGGCRIESGSRALQKCHAMLIEHIYLNKPIAQYRRVK